MTLFAEIKQRWMQDPAVRAEYDALEDKFALIAQLLDAGARAGLTKA